MEMQNDMLQTIKHILTRQEEAAARQEKAIADLKATPAEMTADIIAKIEASQKEILALFRGSRTYGKGTTTCQTEMTSCPEEMDATRLVNPQEREPAVEQQKFRENEINAENIGSSEDWCKDRRLIVRHHRGAKKRSQDSVGSRQKLYAAHKRVICCAIPAV
jgi:hypothetical protein